MGRGQNNTQAVSGWSILGSRRGLGSKPGPEPSSENEQEYILRFRDTAYSPDEKQLEKLFSQSWLSLVDRATQNLALVKAPAGKEAEIQSYLSPDWTVSLNEEVTPVQ